jgi:hypothetical protein
VTVLGLYGLAFIGGWMEQLGTLLGNPTARYLIAASLLGYVLVTLLVGLRLFRTRDL